MSKKILIIVESPGKIGKITSELGDKYMVMASIGHIQDLPKTHISIDIENNFEPTYEIKPDKVDVVKKLKNAQKNASDIIIATDDDREGAMIAHSLAEILKIKNPKRMIFTSITKSALQEALKNITTINNNIVDAQKARRLLDRLIGYKISPLMESGMSAGRVQSVVTKLIVDKEIEIKNFLECNTETYFKFSGKLLIDNQEFLSNLYDKKDNPTRKNNKEAAQFLMKQIIFSKLSISEIISKNSKMNPSAPFTTSTLQQEAFKKYKFSVKLTMSTAQKLYELGHITYMRTDSTELSQEILDQCKKMIINKYGKEYYKLNIYKTKSKNAQEAHEAIRPTHLENESLDLSNEENKLYKLIWERTAASQMEAAEYLNNTIKINISQVKDHNFIINIDKNIFLGFLIIYGSNKENNTKIPNKESKVTLKELSGTQDMDKPPKRYDEKSLIAKLDILKIGRPATTESLISTIKTKQYVIVGDVEGGEKKMVTLGWTPKTEIKENIKNIKIGEEKNKFIPTELGIKVVDFLCKNFMEIMEYKFTSDMEKKLDKIADGTVGWVSVLREFYNKIEPNINLLHKNKIILNKNSKIIGEHPTTHKVITASIGKFGSFIRYENKCYALSEEYNIETLTLEQSLEILKYPKNLGKYKDCDIMICRGKNNFYINYNKNTINVEDENINFDDGVKLIEDFLNNILWQHTTKTTQYTIKKNKTSAYLMIKHLNKKTNLEFISLSNFSLANITFERVKELIAKNKEKLNKEKSDNKEKKNTKEKKNNNDKKKSVKPVKKTPAFLF